MSLRTDYELTVNTVGGDRRPQIPRDLVAAFVASLLWTVTILESSEGGEDDNYLRFNTGDDGFFMLLRDCHPEEVSPRLAEMSQRLPGVILDVEEFVREKTDVVEPGREDYFLFDGQRIDDGHKDVFRDDRFLSAVKVEAVVVDPYGAFAGGRGKPETLRDVYDTVYREVEGADLFQQFEDIYVRAADGTYYRPVIMMLPTARTTGR